MLEREKREKGTQIKYTIRDTRILCGQLKTRKTMEPNIIPLYAQRRYRRRIENLTVAMYFQ